MSDTAVGPGWWQASDGKWYPPEAEPGYVQMPVAGRPGGSPTAFGPVGKPRSAGLTILLAIVTFGLWTIIWSYWNGEEIKNYTRSGVGGVVYVLLMIFISPVVMFLMANEVENLYRKEGQNPQITTLWGLWFLLPLIGNIIWYLRIQMAINNFWMARGAPPAAGQV